MVSSSRDTGCCPVILKFFYSLPVILILGILVWSYYAYVWVVCIQSMATIVEQVLSLITYHILLLLFLTNYLRACLAKPMRPPDNFRLTNEQYIEALRVVNDPEEPNHKSRLKDYIRERKLPVKVVDVNGGARFCVECLYLKPDRAHHCSTCGTCLLKMDHHCPWVSNCVGYHNYKFFVTFLFWGVCYCFFITFSSLNPLIQFWTNISSGTIEGYKFNVLFVFFASVIFGLSQIFLLGFHLFLLFRNQTTLESFRHPNLESHGPDEKAFNLGIRKNVQQVFGKNTFLWGLPVFVDYNKGIDWPTRRGRDQTNGDAYGKLESDSSSS